MQNNGSTHATMRRTLHDTRRLLHDLPTLIARRLDWFGAQVAAWTGKPYPYPHDDANGEG